MKISIVLAALTGSFETDMNRASKTAQKRMKEIEKTAAEVGKKVAVAFTIAATAVAAGVKLAIDRMDEIAKSAQKVGVTTESFSKLAYAAGLAGVETGMLESALAKLSRSQDDAARGTKETLDLFNALGVAFKNADGTLRKSDEVLADLADRFQALPDGANKTAAAMGLLGRSGAQLIPLLNGGSSGLKDMGDELERLGGVVTPEAAKQAEEFNDNLSRLKVAADGLFMSIATDLLPKMVELTEKLVDASKEGGELREAAASATRFVEGLGMAAQLAVDGVQALTFSAIGLLNVLNGVSKFNLSGLFREGPSGDFANARVAFGQAGAAFDETSASLYGAPAAAPTFDFAAGEAEAQEYANQAKAALAAAAAEKALADALAKARTEQERKAAAASAAAAADRAAAAAAREAEKAQREQAAARAEAYDEIQRVFKAEQELKREEAEAQARAKEVVDTLLADLAFEAKLLGLTNLEREKAIALRWANVDAASAEGMAIGQALEELDQAAKVAEGMDVVRDATRGLFSDLMDGSKSASEAFKDFVSNILDGIAQIVARNLTEQLFGSFGSTGGGASGGGLASLFGSFFGGARAGGGDVVAGKAYLVGEKGPELVLPKSAGTVVPAGATAAMLSGRGASTINFNLPGRYDLRTQAQIAADVGRIQQKQLARGTA